MPNIQSAKKALRQNITRRARNLKKREAYKSAVKTYKKLIEAKKIDEAKAQLAKVHQALDKAAKSGVIKKNKAGRIKSRLSHAITRSTKASS